MSLVVGKHALPMYHQTLPWFGKRDAALALNDRAMGLAGRESTPVSVTFSNTAIPGVLLVETAVYGDTRGYFTETYSQPKWREAGHEEEFVQDNLSLSSRGTLRGMHYQIDPHAMGKLIRTVRGAVFDVAVDLREGSPTFAKWVGYTLSAENGLGLWIPPGFAHGFLALEDDTTVYYKCTNVYTPQAERSLVYNDPTVGIEWPFEPADLSEKDAVAPPLDKAEFNFNYQHDM